MLIVLTGMGKELSFSWLTEYKWEKLGGKAFSSSWGEEEENHETLLGRRERSGEEFW